LRDSPKDGNPNGKGDILSRIVKGEFENEISSRKQRDQKSKGKNESEKRQFRKLLKPSGKFRKTENGYFKNKLRKKVSEFSH
jgi:hypothetical protein